ncbi:MAG: hypothetical protein ACNYNY_06280, partial [Candidatus Oxydemutatoraceae bacterium WSBS_2016_MAG_OTU14]
MPASRPFATGLQQPRLISEMRGVDNFSIEWSRVSQAESYRTDLYEGDIETGVRLSRATGAGLSFSIAGLLAGTQYTVYITAVDDEQIYLRSPALVFSQTIDGIAPLQFPMPVIQALAADHSRINLTWGLNRTAGTHSYELNLYAGDRAEGQPLQTTIILDTQQNSELISYTYEVLPAGQYTLRLIHLSDRRSRNSSQPREATVAVPIQIQGLTVSEDADRQEITISWPPIEGATAYQYAYYIEGSAPTPLSSAQADAMVTFSTVGLVNENYSFEVRALGIEPNPQGLTIFRPTIRTVAAGKLRILSGSHSSNYGERESSGNSPLGLSVYILPDPNAEDTAANQYHYRLYLGKSTETGIFLDSGIFSRIVTHNEILQALYNRDKFFIGADYVLEVVAKDTSEGYLDSDLFTYSFETFTPEQRTEYRFSRNPDGVQPPFPIEARPAITSLELENIQTDQVTLKWVNDTANDPVTIGIYRDDLPLVQAPTVVVLSPSTTNSTGERQHTFENLNLVKNVPYRAFIYRSEYEEPEVNINGFVRRVGDGPQDYASALLGKA